MSKITTNSIIYGGNCKGDYLKRAKYVKEGVEVPEDSYKVIHIKGQVVLLGVILDREIGAVSDKHFYLVDTIDLQNSFDKLEG